MIVQNAVFENHLFYATMLTLFGGGMGSVGHFGNWGTLLAIFTTATPIKAKHAKTTIKLM